MTTTFEKADDYTLRKIEMVERVEVIKLDDLLAKLAYLEDAKQTSIAWYDAQIVETNAMIAEAGKIEVVSEKAEIAAAVALEQVGLAEEVTP